MTEPFPPSPSSLLANKDLLRKIPMWFEKFARTGTNWVDETCSHLLEKLTKWNGTEIPQVYSVKKVKLRPLPSQANREDSGPGSTTKFDFIPPQSLDQNNEIRSVLGWWFYLRFVAVYVPYCYCQIRIGCSRECAWLNPGPMIFSFWTTNRCNVCVGWHK